MNSYTLKEAFLKIRKRAELPIRSINKENNCSYLPDDKTPGCFIGILIEDKDTLSLHENEHASCLVRYLFEITNLDYDNQTSFVQQVQIIHDDIEPDNWLEYLDDLYEEFKDRTKIN